ncbi:hypothetical protein EMIT0P44_230104 [Pseudomonas sp. IT-P44]
MISITSVNAPHNRQQKQKASYTFRRLATMTKPNNADENNQAAAANGTAFD